MKHVGILVNTVKSGGAEKQSIYLLNAVKDEFPTTFIVFHGDLVEDKLINLINGNNYSLILLKGSFFSKITQLNRIFKSEKITHLFTYLTKPNLIGSIVGYFSGVKYIYGSIRNSHLPKWKQHIEKTSSFFTVKTIFNNFEGERLFLKKGFKRTTVISNCFYKINPERIRSPKSSKDFIKIITVGRFVPQKDYDTCIETILELKKLKNHFLLQIIGYGELEQEIREKINKLGLNENIQIIINPENIHEYLVKADIYLSTSIFEGTSNSIMEAMNASLPIVATKVGDNNYLIKNGRNGYLNRVKDPIGLALHLNELINDASLRIKFGIESNRLLSENHSFTSFKEKYLEEIG